MKTLKMLVSIIAVAAVIFMGQSFVFGQNNKDMIKAMIIKTDSQVKKDALGKMEKYNAESKLNAAQVKEFSSLIFLANNNVKAIEYAVELSVKAGKYADVFLGIAKTAANAESETALYENILELTYLKLMDTEVMIKKAVNDNAAQLNKDSEAQIKDEIIRLKSKNEQSGSQGTL